MVIRRRGDGNAPLLYERLMLDQMSACRSEHRRLQLMFEQAPGFMAMLEGPILGSPVANHAFGDLVGRRGLIGKPLWEAIPGIHQPGVDEILDGVARSGESFVGHGMSLALESRRNLRRILVDLVFQPLPPAEGEPAGFSSREQRHRGPEERYP